jgi:hypothetical protein
VQAPAAASAQDAGATLGGADAHRMGLIQLPKDKRYSLAVIQGGDRADLPDRETRTIVGRSGSDINLDDPEASRQHAALEIVGDVAILRDLGSTNGTWIEARPRRAARACRTSRSSASQPRPDVHRHGRGLRDPPETFVGVRGRTPD